MRRILAPAFLTTVSLLTGCGKDPTKTHNPPGIVDPPDAGVDPPEFESVNPPPTEPDAGKK